MNTKRKSSTSEVDEKKAETDGPFDNLMPFVVNNEDEIISYIKQKATKETLKSLAPLLKKLEEAVKQLETNNSPATINPQTIVNYDEQLKNVHESTMEKIRAKELKIAERMQKLQGRIARGSK